MRILILSISIDEYSHDCENGILGECDAVRCVAQWSAWSATCGLAKRTLRFVAVPYKVKQESCDGVKTKCPDVEETQVDDLPCKIFVH